MINNPERFCEIPGIDKTIESEILRFDQIVCRNCGKKYSLFNSNSRGCNPICPNCGDCE